MRNGLAIRRPKKKRNIMNKTRLKACVAHFDAGSYTRLQFLCAVSHSVGTHTDALQPRDDASSSDEEVEDNQQATTSSPAARSSTSPAPAPAVNWAANRNCTGSVWQRSFLFRLCSQSC